jgi:OOP family OmpA-OmpF porin
MNDHDGVPDYKDDVKRHLKNVSVDSLGCPRDSDGDGVPDYLDLCPGH